MKAPNLLTQLLLNDPPLVHCTCQSISVDPKFCPMHAHLFRKDVP